MQQTTFRVRGIPFSMTSFKGEHRFMMIGVFEGEGAAAPEGIKPMMLTGSKIAGSVDLETALQIAVAVATALRAHGVAK